MKIVAFKESDLRLTMQDHLQSLPYHLKKRKDTKKWQKADT